MTRRAVVVAILFGLTAALVATGAGLWFWSRLHRPYAGWESEAAVVQIDPGLDAGSMLDRLASAGVLEDPTIVRIWLMLRGGGESLQAGEYRFEGPVSPLEVLDRLRRGLVALHAITIPEGLDRFEVARRIADGGFADAGSLDAEFADPSRIREWDPDAEDLEGYLFPETYHLPRDASAALIADLMVRRFQEAVGDDYASRAADVGLTAPEAVVLASLIEKETSLAAERTRISRVFHNRLERGMRLQCDPTVLYALRRDGRPVDRLLYPHLTYDSPWNTYVVAGLPPGPICNPGLESLEAAVRPADGDELYFVASPVGGHTFSDDLAAHEAAVQVWRRHQRANR